MSSEPVVISTSAVPVKLTIPLPVKSVNLPVLGVVSPIGVPSIVPPFISIAVYASFPDKPFSRLSILSAIKSILDLALSVKSGCPVFFLFQLANLVPPILFLIH